MSLAHQDRLRSLSRHLFGQHLRLEVMIAIAKGDGLVCLTDLAATLGIANVSRLQRPLDDLKAAGLLQPAELGSMQGRRWFRRVPSKAWEWVIELDHVAPDDAGGPAIPSARTPSALSGESLGPRL